jgi:hypothetical protein
MKKSKYMKGGGKSSKYMAAGGMKTEVGKEAKTQSYKEYVQKMFGGGMTEPSMKRNKMMGGGMMGVGNRGFLKQSSMSQPDRPLPRGKKGKGDI